ncbi:transmembrane 9 superfamily member 3-like isoform X2 [Cicer arietinum]|uniref:transmembrane 9 superfamily member 3-like isoform X2 n=1 Tax=Cicer arietinum TaxID=3827 RepID=UPI003CC5591D
MGRSKVLVLWILISLSLLATHVRSDASDHRYGDGDPVPLYANKVSTFHNPSETYGYLDLPFCVTDLFLVYLTLV